MRGSFYEVYTLMSKIPAAFTQEAKKRVYGRRLGRPMGESRQAVIDTLLPQLTLDAASLTEDGTLDPVTLFKAERDIVLEIGFGNGEHTKMMLEQRPERNYIGVEPFINGMSMFLKSIKDMAHDNIRVWMDDAVMLCRSMKSDSLSAIYILNPDPWPKKKHNKRRIVRAETLKEYFRILKPGGDFIMATDVDELSEWMVTETMNHGGFEWQATCEKDWRTMPEGWFVTTRYAAKGADAGRRQSYLLFKKKA
ncbi:MAG: tRNA (guanosine(46)-N7)-methyltransferase TrmB [Micavibrio aeruginosavorus]|uniref:tRNA (guanine-N(7)-)-methyltransferase n=1 Tax=Micavibrio aeruginosavorus TaxID=349221 RepID=A0A2W5MTF0_9BACT|nr:MAG: tRNA (guanosine(46)-N7)-methyltransferase TrmB [Micavibrio aeruginosavorus]